MQPFGHFIDAGDTQELARGGQASTREALHTALALARLGTWTWTLATGKTTLSAECYDILGLDRQTFDGTIEGWLRHVCAEDRGRFPEVERLVCEGQRTFSFEYCFDSPLRGRRVLKSDGEVQLDDGGQVLRIVGTTVDLTELLELRARVHTVAALDAKVESSERVWQQDREFRYTALAGRVLLPSMPAPIGLCRWELPSAVPLRSTWQEHIALLEAHLPFTDFEYRAGPADDPVYIAVSGVPLYDGQGAFAGYRGTARDITSRVRAEQEARRSRVLLEQASRLFRFGGWRLTLGDSMFTGTHETLGLFGLEGAGPVPFDAILDRLEPQWRTVLAAASREPPERFEIEASGTSPEGHAIWLRIVGEAERDQAGQPLALHGAIQDVTAQKEAAERLHEVSKRLTATLESITDVFFTVTRDWVVTYANPEFERLLAVERSQILGRSLWEVFPRGRGGRLHRHYARALNEGATVRFEEYAPTLECWVRGAAFPSEQGLAVHFRDVTESRLARQALQESEERYRLLFEACLDAVLQTHPDGRILRANSAACRMFGMTESELCARGREGLIPPGDARLSLLVADLDKFGKAVNRLTGVRANGERFEAEVSAFRYRDSSGLTHSAVLLRDLTRQLLHEQEMQALNASLADRVRERTTELVAANEELKAFAHSLAHDLRAPISVIDSFSRELEERLEGKQKHYAARVRASAHRLDAYVNALLSLAKLSRAKLVRTRVDISALVENIVSELREATPERLVDVHVQAGMHAFGDERLLRVVLENLLGNAWKFTSKTKAARISFTAEAEDEGFVTYCVRDNGAGFSMEYARKLFASFQRLHSEQEFPGTGIGLASVKRIVARHGGHVWADGREGAGAAFFFTLAQQSADGNSGWVELA